MYKRVIFLFSFIVLCFSVCLLRIYYLSTGNWLAAAASKQSIYKLKVAEYRGNIYDCNKLPLLYKENSDVLAVTPNIQVASKLCEFLNDKEKNFVMNQISQGKPFLLPTNQPFLCNGTNQFKVANRYSENQLAPHIIGYIDKDKNGVCAIEKAFNDYLNNDCGSIYVKYKVDALNRTLSNKNTVVDDTSYKHTKGVVLTIDERIQKIAQNIAATNMERGAIIITEVPSCEIKACVSMPNFSPTNVPEALTQINSPLLNRAFCAYNLGSIFKLVTAAAALENGISGDEKYNCTGEISINNHAFHCFNHNAHEQITLSDALAHSCNTYFVNLVNKITPSELVKMALELGFGRSFELAPNLITAKGNLPSLKELQNKQTLSNLSFGQGSLMASPIQINCLLNTIASDGIYRNPKLVKGLVNENLEYIFPLKNDSGKRVISQKNCEYLKNSMKDSVLNGTSQKGLPDNLSAGAKTGTAQTGIKSGDRCILQAWYAGIYPIDKPKYSIVVFVEDGKGGGETCGPIFKKIVDSIYSSLPEYFN